jgi:hypothetical protein
MDTKDLTPGLRNFLNQLNAAFPDRPTRSDGTIGNTAHQTEHSGHNLDDVKNSMAEWNGDNDSTPEIRAIDITTFDSGVDTQTVVDHLRSLKNVSSVIRYIIYNRKMYKASNAFAPETYHGASAHTEHFHVSGQWTNASDNNANFNYRFGDIPVALTDADKTWIKANTISLDDKIGDKAYPDRTVGDVLRDAAKLRGVLFGDEKDIENAKLQDGAPLATIEDAAFKILNG